MLARLSRCPCITARIAEALVPQGISARFAGGGGRPGGRPSKLCELFIQFSKLEFNSFHFLHAAFNWKHRKLLGLPKENISANEILKRQEITTDDELQKLVASIGGHVVSLNPEDDYVESDEMIAETNDKMNTKKRVRVSLLFGPDKGRGFLPTSHKKRNWRMRHNLWLARTKYGQVE